MIRLLAHQGGWDEVLMFVIPVALAVLLVRRLERRGKVGAPQDETEDQDEPESQ